MLYLPTKSYDVSSITIIYCQNLIIFQTQRLLHAIQSFVVREAERSMSNMTPQQYAAFKHSLKESQERTERMLARIDQTLVGVRETLGQIKQNSDNIQKFQKSYNDVMTQLAQKLLGAFVNPFKKVEGKKYEHLPTSPPIKKLIQSMLKQKEILIVTGAGVSAPSGIPTFRGKGGLYDKLFEWQGKQYTPQQFITHQFYSKHSLPIWQWIQEIYRMATICKPNRLHILIDTLSKALNARGIAVTLVTQNIDDLHIKPEKEKYEYHAIHGNVKYVRCDNFHLTPYQQFREELKTASEVQCPQCTSLLRPHVLFFDESYGPLYGEKVKGRKFPFVILIGTSLSTGLCSSLAQNAEELVQINPQPVIEVGKVYQYTKDTTKVLQQIMKTLGETK